VSASGEAQVIEKILGVLLAGRVGDLSSHDTVVPAEKCSGIVSFLLKSSSPISRYDHRPRCGFLTCFMGMSREISMHNCFSFS
jgi:hypothetical protein